MINNLAILANILGVAYVVMRAIVLDKKLPWFGKAAPPPVRTDWR